MTGRKVTAKVVRKTVQKEAPEPVVQKEAPEPMEEVVQTEEPSRKRPWEKFDADGNKIKRKKVPGAKNLRIKNYVQPRNAVSCLNELVPGLTFDAEQEGGGGQNYGMSVTIEDNTYTGYGPSKQIAKQNAAETALVSFVKQPVKKAGPGEETEKDTTPWSALASLAMYKMFNDWNEGRIGTGHTAEGVALPAGMPNSGTFDLRDFLTMKGVPAGKSAKAQQANAKPAKQVPDNAASMHPLMVLHQMRPTIEYIVEQTTDEDKKPLFNVSVNIEEQEFTGEGSNLKKAKTLLAKNAIFGLFGVESTFEIPA